MMLRPTTRQALAILGMAALLGVAWMAVGRVRGWKAAFGESNYTANRIRLEEYLVRPSAPKAVLVGSSLSGRIQPEFLAGTALEDFATLGLDGSIPLVGLEALERRADVPAVVFVETYLMHRGPGPNDRVLVEGLASPGTALARHVPLVRASQRPSSLLYSSLKTRREGGGGVVRTNVAGVELPGEPVTVTAPDPVVLELWRARLRSLAGRGVQVVLVDLPSGEVRMPGPRAGRDTADVLAGEFGLRRVDLRKEWFSRGWSPGYTDGRHLDAASATATARMLVEAMR